jgi:D-tyrosyl-tRNA(Tyr) deacylase
MRAVVQRSGCSRVEVDGKITGEIKLGLTVLLGIKKGDTPAESRYMMDKILNLRIFEDENGKMNRSLLDVQGELLLVSQFTLYGDCRKGRRPGFDMAELPEAALPLFNYCLNYVKEQGLKVQTGIFGANMKLSIENQGPCTIILDSEKIF